MHNRVMRTAGVAANVVVVVTIIQIFFFALSNSTVHDR